MTVAEMIEELSKLPQDIVLLSRDSHGWLYTLNWPKIEMVDKETLGDIVGSHSLRRGDEIVVI